MVTTSITKESILAYQAYLHSEERSASTIENYLRHVRAFAAWLGDHSIDKTASANGSRACFRATTPQPPSTPCWQRCTAISAPAAGHISACAICACSDACFAPTNARSAAKNISNCCAQHAHIVCISLLSSSKPLAAPASVFQSSAPSPSKPRRISAPTSTSKVRSAPFSSHRSSAKN